MTKKHYKLLAGVLGKYGCEIPIGSKAGMRFQMLVSDICWALKVENPRFSKDKFTEAVFSKEVDAESFVDA